MLDQTHRPVCRVQGGYLPQYAHNGDAGADLRAAEDTLVPARGQASVGTGIRVALPHGYVGLVWSRSGLAFKRSIDCGAGVVDSTYRGEVRVLLFNHSDEDCLLKKGERIAQLLIQKVETVDFIQVAELDDTSRGEAGFGSTGE